MVPVFAGHNRRELKMKFKKEERVNRSLVNKALKQPMEFNITKPQEEVDNLKRKAEEEQALKAKRDEEWAREWLASKKNAVIPYIYSRIKKEPSKNKGLRQPKQRKPDLYDILEKGITSIWNSDSKSTEQDFQKILRPIRCANITKHQEEVDNLKNKAEEQALKAKRAEGCVASKKNAISPYSHLDIREQQSKNKGLKRPKQRKPKFYDKLKKGIASMWNSDSGEESDSKSTDQDFQNILKPTRYGRIPKLRKLFNYTATTSTSLEKQEPQSSNNMQDLNDLRPGSHMIVCDCTGQPAFKVFMATPSQNKVPITLTHPDMTSNLTQLVNEPNAEEELPPEYNCIIAHNKETDLKKISEENIELPNENIVTSTEAAEQQLCAYKPNLSIPVENIITLTEENVTLWSDGKYDVNLK